MEKILEEICKAENITLTPFDLEISKGIAINANGCKSIGYDKNLKGWHKTSVIAHELGHHALGHLENDRIDENNEIEAQVFSAAFTAMAMFMGHILRGNQEI